MQHSTNIEEWETSLVQDYHVFSPRIISTVPLSCWPTRLLGIGISTFYATETKKVYEVITRGSLPSSEFHLEELVEIVTSGSSTLPSSYPDSFTTQFLLLKIN